MLTSRHQSSTSINSYKDSSKGILVNLIPPEFFKSKNHKEIPSASLVPENDPTVLFTTAGMHPLVPFLMGKKHPLGNKLTSIQKLFNVLDVIKTTNSDISTKLYELREKLEDQKVYDSAYELIEELDAELKKLNLNIDELQQQLYEPVKRRKCDFDVEIARDVFNFSNYFESLILFSGDGDYAALVEDLTINKGKKVIVVFAPGHKGKEYEKISVSAF